MDFWLIALIIFLSVLGLALLVLFIAYLTYRLAFYSGKNKENEAYLKKVIKAYGEYGAAFDKITENLKNTESERVFVEFR